jgi:anti-sigma-K factor RskA
VVVPLRRRWQWLGQGLVAAAAVVLAIVLSLPGVLPGSSTTELRMVADSGAAIGRAVVTETEQGRQFQVEIEGLDPPPDGQFYELWAVGPEDTEDDPQRVSLGTFTVGAGGDATFDAFTAASAAQYPLIGVTLEPDDGDPARTGPRVLRPLPR